MAAKRSYGQALLTGALVAAFLTLHGAVSGGRIVHAQVGDVAAAAKAFEQAQRAELSGNPARAAELYELADHMAPAPEALRNATRMRLAAGQHAAAATHAEALLQRYGDDAESRALAEEVLRRTRDALARLDVRCEAPCTLIVDGLAAGTTAQVEHVLYVEPGGHELIGRFEREASNPAKVDVIAGDARSLTLTVPPPVSSPVAAEESKRAEPTPAAVPAETRRGVSPVYFWVMTGATLAVGGVTVWSGVDLLKARDDFKADKTPTRKAFEEGEKKDLRTSVLLGSSIALAVGTTVLAFFTDFRGERVAPAVAVSGHELSLGVRGAF